MPFVSSRKTSNKSDFSDAYVLSSVGDYSLEEIPLKGKRNSGSPYLISKQLPFKNKQQRNADYYGKKMMNFQFWNNNSKVNVVKSGTHLDNCLTDYQQASDFKNRPLVSATDFADGDVEDNDMDEEEDEEDENISLMFVFNKMKNSYSQKINIKTAGSNNNKSLSPILAAKHDTYLDKDVSSSKWNINKKFKDMFNKKSDSFQDILNSADIVASTSDAFQPLSNADLESDYSAREKVLQYVNETIDELWARFCDCSTLVEEEIHSTNEKSHTQPNHERSFSTSSADKGRRRRNTLISLNTDNNADLVVMPSELESSAYKLKMFKNRIFKYKKEMEILVDSSDMEDIKRFWNIWDIVKWDCVKLMETEEDEEDYLESELESKSDSSTLERCEEALNALESKRVF